MLNSLGRHVVFVTIFMVSMVLFLAISVITFAALSGEGMLNAANGGFGVVKAGFFLAVSFMLLSGFLPAYVVMYGILLHKTSRVSRMLLSALIFVLAYIFLWFLISDWSIGSGDWVLLPGVVSVAISDLLAGVVTRRRTAPVSFSDRK